MHDITILKYINHKDYSDRETLVIIRKERLLIVAPNGDEENLTQLNENTFCIGEPEVSPERLHLDQIVNGQAWRATRSGCTYNRFFTP